MTINHVLKRIQEIRDTLDNIDFDAEKDRYKKIYNQKQVHKAYEKLNSFMDECFREKVLMLQRREKDAITNNATHQKTSTKITKGL